MTKITPESEADFLTSMIERDLNNNWTRKQKIKYFSLIAVFISNRGLKLLKSKSKTMSYDQANAFNETLRNEYNEEHGVNSKTPSEFIEGSDCLTGKSVQDWFKRKDIGPYSFDHIHVYEDRWWMVIKDNHNEDILTCKCTWKDGDGNIHQNTMLEITKLIFTLAYLPSLEKIDVQNS